MWVTYALLAAFSGAVMATLTKVGLIKIAWLGYCLTGLASAEDRVERFDRDPRWDGHNNRATSPEPRATRQDFGYSRTAHAGGRPGEVGGFLCPAAEPAYYAKVIPAATLDDELTASGTLSMDGRPTHALIGFFNAGTLNEWRTPNTIALRVSGRDDVFYAWVEYATGRWRAGGDEPRGFPKRRDPRTGRTELVGFTAKGQVHGWSLRYDPAANGGGGAVTATIDDQTAVCHLSAGHKADGATFNRFGILDVMKSADAGGELWMDDVTINGVSDDFAVDPKWDARRNHVAYVSSIVRPRFDFGFSPTRYAAGRAGGELGGLIFRGDCRYPTKMACYGDRLAVLTLEKPLRASGRVSLRRGVTDSTILIGFYHSRDSMAVNPSQDSGLPASFLGVSVEGPSREGIYFAPAYRARNARRSGISGKQPPRIDPDGVAHDWTLEYSPTAAAGRGQITLTLDGKAVHLDLDSGTKAAGTRFDRFGIVTTWVDGNSQTIFFDDLTYTCGQ
jgi:hypothetical protein